MYVTQNVTPLHRLHGVPERALQQGTMHYLDFQHIHSLYVSALPSAIHMPVRTRIFTDRLYAMCSWHRSRRQRPRRRARCHWRSRPGRLHPSRHPQQPGAKCWRRTQTAATATASSPGTRWPPSRLPTGSPTTESNICRHVVGPGIMPFTAEYAGIRHCVPLLCSLLFFTNLLQFVCAS